MTQYLKHIKQSHGPDTNISKFYVTQYSTTYGKQWEKFEPRGTRHYGTGYLANFRPGVYYSKGLDLRDNPTMAHLLTANYNTITKMDYQPWCASFGGDPFPRGLYQSGSGFVREKPLNIATSKEVNNVCIDTRVRPLVRDILPKHVPLLHKINCRDPVALENTRYGPGFMSTEAKERFRGLPTDNVDRSNKTLGRLTESGAVHNKNIEPISFRPDYAHKNDQPAWMTNRPIGKSVTKESFVPMENPDGRDKFGVILQGSERGSGFTREPPKPAFQHEGPHDGTPHTVTTDHFTGQQHPSKTMPDILERTDCGHKNETGFTENRDIYLSVPETRDRFVTDNHVRFIPPDNHIRLLHPYTRGNVQERKESGFNRSAVVHGKLLGDEPNSTEALGAMEAYQARSIKARDRFHDDHTHDHKLYKSLSANLERNNVAQPILESCGTLTATERGSCANDRTHELVKSVPGTKLKKSVTFSSDMTRAYTHT